VTLVLRYAARSDRGLVRSNNQDSVYAGPRLLAVADGMGGHAGGEVASKVVIAAVAPLDDDEPGHDLLAQLEDALLAGNDAIIELVAQEPELSGMGTTLTAILFAGTRLGLAHVGDSRAYLLRQGSLSQITKDDTFVQSLIDEGRLTEDEAAHHPQRSLILRALNGDDVEPSLTVREARDGDRYLLCSDGLSSVVSAETIAEALRIEDPQDSADRLIELALRSGGPDNITVIVADVIELEFGEDLPIVGGAVSGVEDDGSTPDTAAGRAAAVNPSRAAPRRVEPTGVAEPPARRSRRRLLVVAGLVLLVLVVAAVAGRAWLKSNYYVGEKNGTVAVLQGLPGTVLGVALQEVTLQGCVSDDGTVALVGPALPSTCDVLQVDDLQPAERAQVSAGLPGGSLEDARGQITRLTGASLLPVCGTAGAAASATASTSSTAPTTAPTTAAPPTPTPVVPPVPGSTPTTTTPTTTSPTTTSPQGTDLAAPTEQPGQTCRPGR
jgi:serine/threonine protein phosphatase PrpC